MRLLHIAGTVNIERDVVYYLCEDVSNAALKIIF